MSSISLFYFAENWEIYTEQKDSVTNSVEKTGIISFFIFHEEIKRWRNANYTSGVPCETKDNSFLTEWVI